MPSGRGDGVVAAAAPVLQVHLLGGFQLLGGDGSDITPRGRKARAVLAVLAMSPGGAVARERLSALLWSRHADEQARASLRQSLLELRKSIDPVAPELVTADRETLRLDLSRVWVDVLALMNAPALSDAGPCETRLAAVGKELLADPGIRDDAFDEWLRDERARVRETLTRRLETALQASSGEPETHEALADALLRLDSLSETAHRVRIWLAASRGDQALARRYYQALKARLAEELGVPPSAATEALMRDLDARAPASPSPANGGGVAGCAEGAAAEQAVIYGRLPAVAPGERAGEGEPVVMVLPFSCSDAGGERAYLGDGLAEDVITALSRFRSFAVLARSTSFAYRERAHDPRGLAADPGADYVLEGSVRIAGGRLRISAHLAECISGREVWGERFDCGEDEIFDVQDEIVSRIASRLDHQLSYQELRRQRSAPAQSLRAYDYCLQGIVLNSEWNAESDERSVRMFERAIELEPDYARPYACLAGVCTVRNILRPGYPHAEADRERALALATRAVTLDPHDARNQVNLGWCRMLAHEWAPAAEHFALALDANPNDADILITCALAYGYLGQEPPGGASALELADRAIALNPRHPPYYHAFRGSLQFLAGDYAAAAETLDRVPDIFPDIHAWRAATLAGLDEAGAAASEADRFLGSASALWAGAGTPTRERLLAWTFDITPLRRAEDRARLECGLCIDDRPQGKTRPKSRHGK